MVLTPDQKKRIAALENAPAEGEEESQDQAKASSGQLKSATFKVSSPIAPATALKALLVVVLVAVAGYFVANYQLHRIDYKDAFSSGSPFLSLKRAWALQKQKADMLEEGQAQLLVGDYDASFLTARAVSKLDDKDERAGKLTNLTADACAQRAKREFDSGEIEAALADARLTLKYRPDHKAARDLELNIASRLLHESKVHFNKKEYSQLITKAQEVLRINSSDVTALNLLMRTNKELLDKAGDLFISQRYLEALEHVQLALKIDPKNPTADRLLNSISAYIETPKIELRGIVTRRGVAYARIQLRGRTRTVKQGDRIENFKIVEIDPKTKAVELLQIYTKQKKIITQTKAE